MPAGKTIVPGAAPIGGRRRFSWRSRRFTRRLLETEASPIEAREAYHAAGYAIAASTLSLPEPRDAMNRNTQQYTTASSPWFWIGSAPCP